MVRKHDDEDEGSFEEQDRPRSRRRRDEEDDEEEERPRSKRRKDEEVDEEDEDRTRRKRQRDDDEADEADDRRRSSRKKGKLDRGTLRSIAIYQKVLLLCILVYVIAVVTGIFMPQELKFIPGLIGIPAVLTGTVFVFLLSTKVFNIGIGLLLGFLTLIPCVGLIILLIINITATSTLKANGIHVGFLGASLSDLE